MRIVVAPAQPVQKEWRLVIADGRPIAGSQYRDAGQTAILRDTPSVVFHFAEAALRAANWQPDPLFMFDVCEAAGELRIVEAGPFSGCSLYDCDPQPIVAAASRHAAAAWAEIHGC